MLVGDTPLGLGGDIVAQATELLLNRLLLLLTTR
jgi:hypothetical protein